MPTYEYRCPKGHHFELFQRMSDEPRATCPQCGATSERLLSGGAGLLFRGDGFYITDYRSDAYKKEASKEEGGGQKEKVSGAGAEKKVDSSTTGSGPGGASPSSSPGKTPSEGT